MKIYFIFVLLCGKNVFGDDSDFFNGHYDGFAIPPPSDTTTDTLNAVKTDFFAQTIDHYDPTNTAQFWQRYFVNTQYFNQSAGNVAFLFVSGEAQALTQWMTQGAWIQTASRYGALLFQLEHRYYGQSHPFQDISTANLRYLSSQQALEDIATFINAMNIEYNLPADVKWILFGGSYSASLALWARQKYPHLVHGAMASSGPVFAKFDFYEYLEVVADALAVTHSQECADTVKVGYRQLEELLVNPGTSNVTEMFNLCFDITDSANNISENIAYFFERISSPIAGVVQYHGIPGQTTINTICNVLTNVNTGREVDRLGRLASMFHSSSCLNYRFEALVTSMQRTTITASGNMRQWYYQTCTEFGWYQSTDQEEQVFGNRNPSEFYSQLCTRVFGSAFTDNYIIDQNKRINRYFGGFDIDVTNVIHVQGSLDPWFPVGLTETVNPESPVIFINGTSHCANLYPISANDIPKLTEARVTIDWLIGVWLGVNSGIRIHLSVSLILVGILAKLF